MNSQLDFFISYSNADQVIARQLYNLLKPKFTVFLAEHSLAPGSNWRKDIPGAQRNSFISIIILTGNEISHYQNEELLYAISLSQHNSIPHQVIPLIFGRAELSFGLLGLNAITADHGLTNEIIEKLEQALFKIKKSQVPPTQVSKSSTDPVPPKPESMYQSAFRADPDEIWKTVLTSDKKKVPHFLPNANIEEKNSSQWIIWVSLLIIACIVGLMCFN
ncbi:MAG: toll/interleukin-1 receptor domain-containing protein, partial [Chitinophagaceae bacterium]